MLAPLGGLAPPPRENPGSATDFSSYILVKPLGARGIIIFLFPSLFCLADFLYAQERATPGYEY